MPSLTAQELRERTAELHKLLDPCRLCPRLCQARRLNGATGFCQVGDTALLSSATPHFGEEPPITGRGGSGTIFLSSCNAACIFCQNYQISHERIGRPVSTLQLAHEFLQLQAAGCENINWVTPTPHLPFLVEALALAVEQGLNIPLVYNTNGYDRVEILQLLDGVVDIYLPDMKYAEDIWAEEYSGLQNYFDVNVAAVREMYRQVGALVIDKNNVARKGLLIRHLVLPDNRAGSARVFRALAAIDPHIPVSLMAQYHPCYKAIGHAVLGRRITRREYLKALEDFENTGVLKAYTQDYQDLEREDLFFPDFNDNERIFNHRDNRKR
ncbi:MAG: radical SAM protein [Candidatus Marinimicrobia bacterium]|jgi:putative pyruvate formate lyase activating enzyme|nr:radical SAM protein [Candidatus Neomarinimicrobiota bacterium]MCK9483938.1 radical SAM protein [Candidatus Neomarinimicrobiota bacterium]MCK9560545.1 radical SAM protein [Candidatus Neomarinimicrobiota bacterium]